jgi:CRP-like cAMP-binding protein
MQTILDQILEHPFFETFPPQLFEDVAICAETMVFDTDELIYRQGDEADAFYLIQNGRIALELPAGHQGILIIQTIGEGEMLGWSWIFPPYRRQFDARSLRSSRAIVLQAECLRRQCQSNHHLGHELYRRFSQAALTSLQAARFQLLDLYGHQRPGPDREEGHP